MEKVLAVIGWMAAVACALLLSNFIVVFIWNTVVAAVFGLPILTYWQAYAITIMIRGILPSNTRIKLGD